MVGDIAGMRKDEIACLRDDEWSFLEANTEACSGL